MLAIERRRKITSILEEKGSVLVVDLSSIFNVTEETIRRDLERLENEGLLKRTYGGAVALNSTDQELPTEVREVTNAEAKTSIGEKVAEYIQDGDAIMLDSSTTALKAAENIKDKKNITVITNSIKAAAELTDTKYCRVISTGGTLRKTSMSLVGHLAEDSVRKFNVDIVIIGCKGIDMVKGITESNEMEAEVKKAMLESAEKVFLVADNTKFDKVSFTKMLRFEQIDKVFTNQKLSEEWEQFLSNNNVELIYC